jgi:N-acetylmuramoyl-L-alanine amidase
MKRIVSFLLIIIFLFLIPVVVMAVNKPIDLYLNGKKLQTEVAPIVVDGHTYLNMQTITGVLGIDVVWNSTQKKATIKEENVHIEMVVGVSNSFANGKQVQLMAAPVIVNDHVYLPFQPIGEQIGIKVNWDVLTQSVMLYKKDKSFLSPKELFEVEPSKGNSILPPVLIEDEYSGNLSTITSIKMLGNQIFLQFDAMVSPQSFYLSDPHRFVIDLPYSRLGPVLIGQESQQSGEVAATNPLIQKIRYALNDSSTVRIVIDLSQKVEFKVTENKNTNQVTIDLIEKAYKIVIDPGHGGKDPGADGASGRYEKHFTLELSNKIQTLLDNEPNLQVYMTRTDDSFISLDDRVKFANNINADLFISIHGNTFTSLISGTETYYWHQESMPFALIIHQYAVEGAQLPDRNLRKMQYRVLRDAKMPVALLELGYLSNAEEEKVMLTKAFQDRVAASIVKGIKEYLKN